MNIKLSPYKAAGNGLTDDRAAIQAAIDAVAASGGGTVLLPAGDYLLSAPLTWNAPDVYLEGDGAARLLPTPSFAGYAAIMMGNSSTKLSPTYRGGIANITVDLKLNQSADLVGVQLAQTWFARVDLLRIMSPNGLPKPLQTAFQMSAGAAVGSAPETIWSANNVVRDLQVSGSFMYSVRHVNGGAPAMVNGTNYFGGFAYGTAADKTGTCGFCIDEYAGDSTRVYGMALEDYDVGVYVGSQNNGSMDFRIEGCNTPYASAPGITFSVPAMGSKP